MGCLEGKIADDEHAYVERCKKYNEKVRYDNYYPDCYGKHAHKLRDRERAEKEKKKK